MVISTNTNQMGDSTQQNTNNQGSTQQNMNSQGSTQSQGGVVVINNQQGQNTQQNQQTVQITTTTTTTTQSDPNCMRFNGTRCAECFSFFYFNQVTARCMAVSSLCMDYNRTNGQCTACWPGYNLSFGVCVQQRNSSQSTTSNIQNMNTNQQNMNTSQQTTTTTTNQGQSNMNTMNNNNQQTTQTTTTTTTIQQDLNCMSRNGTVCIECFDFYYVSARTGLCVAVSSLCR